jgi:hypothetical protein
MLRFQNNLHTQDPGAAPHRRLPEMQSPRGHTGSKKRDYSRRSGMGSIMALKTMRGSPVVRSNVAYQVGYWLLLSLLIALGHLGHRIDSDEGAVLNGAWRLWNGQEPYIDFFTFITPGSYYIVFGLWKVFGSNYLVAKIFAVLSLFLACVGIHLSGRLLTLNGLSYLGRHVCFRPLAGVQFYTLDNGERFDRWRFNSVPATHKCRPHCGDGGVSPFFVAHRKTSRLAERVRPLPCMRGSAAADRAEVAPRSLIPGSRSLSPISVFAACQGCLLAVLYSVWTSVGRDGATSRGQQPCGLFSGGGSGSFAVHVATAY